MAEFAKQWFFATGDAIKPTPLHDKAGAPTVPALVAKLHDLLAHEIVEYQWAEIGQNGGNIDGWFQPKNVHVRDTIAAIPGVTLLPSLKDGSPAGPDLSKLLGHAGVGPTDNGYTVIKKLCDHHHTAKDGYRHAGLRAELY